MAEIRCDRYGFFNGIYGIEQSNWANFWRGIIPDGIVAGQDDELEVYTASAGEGMQVRVKTGQALVDNHRAWVTSEKVLTISAADSTNPRIDLIVLRATYGNRGQSRITIATKEGTPAASPEAPELTQTTGGTYEVVLAQIAVSAGTTNILPENITDLRFIYHLSGVAATSFSGNALTVQNDWEYRCSDTSLSSLAITLPDNPSDIWQCSVVFSSGSSFSGISFLRNGTTYTPKLQGVSTNLVSQRYNLLIFWDGAYFWVNVEAA